jgi:hypothetical protein
MSGGNPVPMPNEHQTWTPFAAPSWEPRFALDWPRADTGLLALALCLHANCVLGRHVPLDTNQTFRGYVLGPARLAVAAIAYSYPLTAGDVLFDGASVQSAAETVTRWLEDQAVYPPQPWFDGGEERGFQSWHVAYLDDSGPSGPGPGRPLGRCEVAALEQRISQWRDHVGRSRGLRGVGCRGVGGSPA